MFKGCIRCGYITKADQGFCPDCGDALILAFETRIFGAEGALGEQKKWCEKHDIQRDWDNPMHKRTSDHLSKAEVSE